MKVSLLLLIITVSGCSCTRIEAEAGRSITLTCKYDKEYYGALSVCWNRGEIPLSGCDNVLVSTDGLRVIDGSRLSRFQLLGQLSRGDVSLTILNVTGDDAGRYGCRVEIPGWFNDGKHHFDLLVVPRRRTSPSQPWPSPSSPSSPSSSSWATTTNETAGHVTPRDTPLTEVSSRDSSVQPEGGGLTVILVGVLFGLLFLVTAGGLLVMGRRWRRLNKLPQSQAAGSAGFSSTSSTMQLHCRNSTVENIYQIDENEYNYCP